MTVLKFAGAVTLELRYALVVSLPQRLNNSTCPKSSSAGSSGSSSPNMVHAASHAILMRSWPQAEVRTPPCSATLRSRRRALPMLTL
jgi:hypothetical protein